MFTGRIQAVGRVASMRRAGPVLELVVEGPGFDAEALKPGESVAVGGICLTAASFEAAGFRAQAVPETSSVTTLARWRPGRRVNLERALAVGERLDGHWVTGHVDGRARVEGVRALGASRRLRLAAPGGLERYIPRKGSVALDGVSLTVARADGASFEVALIPATLERTTLGDLRPGDEANLEVDVLARTIERLGRVRGPGVPEGGPGAAGEPLEDVLRRSGWLEG